LVLNLIIDPRVEWLSEFPEVASHLFYSVTFGACGLFNSDAREFINRHQGLYLIDMSTFNCVKREFPKETILDLYAKVKWEELDLPESYKQLLIGGVGAIMRECSIESLTMIENFTTGRWSYLPYNATALIAKPVMIISVVALGIFSKPYSVKLAQSFSKNMKTYNYKTISQEQLDWFTERVFCLAKGSLLALPFAFSEIVMKGSTPMNAMKAFTYGFKGLYDEKARLEILNLTLLR